MARVKQCAEHGCMVAVPLGTRHCDKHKPISGWVRNPSRSNRERKRSARPWSRVRQRVMQRDNYCCVSCGNNGRIVAGNEVDHIDPLGGDELENLQLLCRTCHKRKTQQESIEAQRQKANV